MIRIPTASQDARRCLVEDLTERGFLHDSAWREAFRAVPREAFLRRFAIPSPDGNHRTWDLDECDAHDEALAAVYRDVPLLTQIGANGTATSSSTAPSLMALMLEALDVQAGMKVLEVGAGTGYNAALLCHRLGSELVTTVDLDSRLVAAARKSLEQVGHQPVVVCGDGLEGCPGRAPYDRLIATCGVARVPTAWLRQVRPRGVILASVGFGLARLTVRPDGTASGPFIDYASFMPARRAPDELQPTPRETLALAGGGGHREVTPFACWDDLEERMPVFLRSLMLPDVHQVTLVAGKRTEYVLADHASGSWARAQRREPGTVSVVQHGPRRLWDELHVTLQTWIDHSRPPLTSCGLHVDTEGRHELWLTAPDGARLPMGQRRPLNGS
ncbi:methyltransferase domain-containing protein [Streptomyces sp. NPDC049881]|uniref:methyltransferase domain-containing protein n=1 Tax=Streptomyces sp. NPDC049881 TaxID=3155778 RepID=UPI0034154E81